MNFVLKSEEKFVDFEKSGLGYNEEGKYRASHDQVSVEGMWRVSVLVHEGMEKMLVSDWNTVDYRRGTSMSAGWYEEYCENCGHIDGIAFFKWLPHNMVFPKCPKCGHYTMDLQKSKIPVGTIPTREEEPA